MKRPGPIPERFKGQVSLEIVDSVLRPFYRVADALEAEFLLVSDVKKILKVTKRQLLHWDKGDREMNLKKAAKSKDHSWRKFSIFDVFMFAIFKKLRKIGVGLNLCCFISGYLRTTILCSLSFLYQFAEGQRLFAVIGFGDDDKFTILECKAMDCLDDEDSREFHSRVVLDLSAILKEVLEAIQTKDFRGEFVDNQKGHYKAIFFIGPEKIEFMPTEKVFGYFEEKAIAIQKWGVRDWKKKRWIAALDSLDVEGILVEKK